VSLHCAKVDQVFDQVGHGVREIESRPRMGRCGDFLAGPKPIAELTIYRGRVSLIIDKSVKAGENEFAKIRSVAKRCSRSRNVLC
jgi:hypothetical protein